METYTVTVTPNPEVKLPKSRRWLASFTTNQTLDSTAHVIANAPGEPMQPREVELNFAIKRPRRHDGVPKDWRIVIIEVFVSEPEKDFGDSSHATETGPLGRQFAQGADEVMPMYFGKRFPLLQLESNAETVIQCRPRNELKEYSETIGFTITISNKTPRRLSANEDSLRKHITDFLSIMSPSRAEMIETSLGKKLSLKEWRSLRRLEAKTGSLAVVRSQVNTGHSVRFRPINLPPKSKEQYESLNLLTDYRQSAAVSAQKRFYPPNITVVNPDASNPRERRKKLDMIDMLFYDMNYFHENPIVCCMMDMGANTNEAFWLNMLRIAKKFAELGGVEFDPKTGWVHMLTLINAAGQTYVLETTDIYCEGWFSRSVDCDESFQSVQLFQMFLRAELKDPELRQLQKHANGYYPFCAFWYATTPAANDEKTSNDSEDTIRHPQMFKDGSEMSEGDPVGHMSALFIKREFFERMLDPNEGRNLTGDDNILVGEGTSLMAPKLNAHPPQAKYYLYADKLAQRSASSHKFYTRLMGLFSPAFLDDNGMHSFLCYSKTVRPDSFGRHELGVPTRDLLDRPWSLGVFPYPSMDDEMLSLCRLLADARAYCPDFLFEVDSGNRYCTGLAPKKTFVSTDDCEGRFAVAEKKLRELFAAPVVQPVKRPSTEVPIETRNEFQPSVFVSTGEPTRQKPQGTNSTKVSKVFTVDDLLYSGDALREIRKVMRGFRIEKIERAALMQLIEVLFVDFEKI